MAQEPIFLETLRAKLVEATARSTYDHRPFMPQAVKDAFPHMLEDCQLQYARFKLAVAEILRPRTIYEVGIGWGVSAEAFLEGYPETSYYGIDSGEMGVEPLDALATTRSASVIVQKIASDSLSAFVHPHGPIDLIHIDGGHGRAQKCRDMIKAYEARPEWILVDDFANKMVAAGTMDGVWRAGQIDTAMLYFENSHTGNLLIHANRAVPDYRD